jgi:hypothetical protein
MVSGMRDFAAAIAATDRRFEVQIPSGEIDMRLLCASSDIDADEFWRWLESYVELVERNLDDFADDREARQVSLTITLAQCFFLGFETRALPTGAVH